ncbi:glycosyltransferase [bacterium]|nr:glycosyltransferase [bacterium]
MPEEKAKSTIELSIIIPSYKRTHLLEKLLQQIISISSDQNQYKPNFEVIVVDDGSPNIVEKETMLQQFSFNFPFTFLKQKNSGPATARNHGLRHAQGRYIAFLDDDALPQDNWLEEILKPLLNNNADGVAGLTLAVSPKSISERYLNHVQHLHAHHFSEDGSLSYICTANCAFKKSALDDINGFNEEFRFPAGDDMDLGFRLRQKGYRFFYNEDALVLHHHRQSLYLLFKLFFISGRGAYRCAKIHEHYNTEHVTSKTIFEPKKVFLTLWSIIKKCFKDFSNKNLSLLDKMIFPFLEVLTHTFYQLGRWYEKIFAKKPLNH